MPTTFNIASSDPALLERATRLAEDFAQRYQIDGMVGIVFLGSVVRGYFDSFADIDVFLYKATGADIDPPEQYIHEQGFEIHTVMLDYDSEVESDWGMAKRWAYSTHRIAYDPQGLIARLLEEKVRLLPEERHWLIISGMALSNWYCDTLPRLWIARGDLTSAQHMFEEGVTHFLNALFALNNEMVADVKWRFYAAERLPILPRDFSVRIREVMRLADFTESDIERRRQAFKDLWNEVLPLVEAEVQMPYAEFSKLV